MTFVILLEAARRRAETLMTDQCVIRRQTGRSYDTSQERYTPIWSVVYDGPCRVRQDSSWLGDRTSEGQVLTEQRLILALPWDTSGGVEVDDVAEVSAYGLTVRVASRFTQSQATARRLSVEAVDG